MHDADNQAVLDPHGRVLPAHGDPLSARQEFLSATLHALRAEAEAIRAQSAALRVASHALRVESVGLRGDSAALRARSQVFCRNAAEEPADYGAVSADAPASVAAQGRPDDRQREIGPIEEKESAAASDGGTAAELALGDAMNAISQAFRTLTGNLIRIVSGSGRSSEIIGQLLAVAVALEQYSNLASELPDERAIAELLHRHRDDLGSETPDDRLSRRLLAEDDVMKAALLIAASRLMSQPAIEAIGFDELYQGIQSVLSLPPR